MRRVRSWVGVAAVTGAAAMAAVLLAGSRGPDPGAVPSPPEVNERVMSPFCTGLTLAECPSQQAVELRQAISGKIDEGWTNRRIDAWLRANYGPSVLARPRGMLAWAGPAAALAAGGVVLALALGSRRAGTPAPLPPPVDALDRSLLEETLGRFREGLTE